MKKSLLLVPFLMGFVFSLNAQWVEQATGFPTANRGIRYISAVNTEVVWATAYDGSISGAPEIQEFTKTTNGGATWQAYTINGYSGDGLAMIYAIDSLTAWIPVWYSTGGGTIIKTTDGGTTWIPTTTTEFPPPGGFPNVVHFWDANNGFAMGDPVGGYFEIYTTTNGGTNWTRVPQADIPNPISGSEYGTTGLYSVVGDIIWFTTGKGRVYKSLDRGYHWTVAPTPNTANQLAVDFKDANFGIVMSNQSPFDTYSTNDGGATWQPLYYGGNFYTNDFCFVNGTTSSWVTAGADIGAGLSGLSYSTDDGQNFTLWAGTELSQFLKVEFPAYNVGYAGSFNTDQYTGGMWKYAGSDFALDSCSGFAAVFFQNYDTVDLYVSGSVDFTDASTGNVTGWTWSFGDGGSDNTADPSHTYTGTGTFDVMVIISGPGGCLDTAYSTVVVINTSLISENLSDAGIQVYPNPAAQALNIVTSGNTCTIEIINGLGQVIYIAGSSDAFNTIDVSKFEEGLFFIRIIENDRIITGVVSISR